MSQILHTVNVIDITDAQNYTVQQLASFPDDPAGNEAAEQRFREWVEQAADPANPPSADDIEVALEDGRFEIGEGAILIVHST